MMWQATNVSLTGEVRHHGMVVTDEQVEGMRRTYATPDVWAIVLDTPDLLILLMEPKYLSPDEREHDKGRLYICKRQP